MSKKILATTCGTEQNENTLKKSSNRKKKALPCFISASLIRVRAYLRFRSATSDSWACVIDASSVFHCFSTRSYSSGANTCPAKKDWRPWSEYDYNSKQRQTVQTLYHSRLKPLFRVSYKWLALWTWVSIFHVHLSEKVFQNHSLDSTTLTTGNDSRRMSRLEFTGIYLLSGLLFRHSQLSPALKFSFCCWNLWPACYTILFVHLMSKEALTFCINGDMEQVELGFIIIEESKNYCE